MTDASASEDASSSSDDARERSRALSRDGAREEGAEAWMTRAGVMVLVLCGTPAVGKTALARAMEATRPDGVDVVARVSFDDVEREGRADGDDAAFDPAAWRRARAKAKANVANAVRNGVTSGKRVVVIVDDNMYYNGMRTEMFRLARDHGAACVVMHVRANAETARERNAQRGRSEVVDARAFDRMVDAFEAPILTEPGCSTNMPAFEVDTSVSFPDARDCWDAAVSRWGAAPLLPESEHERERIRELARAETAKSALHALDGRARAAVSRAVDFARRSASDVTLVAESVDRLRRDLLRDARAIDRSTDDAFEQLAILERRFIDALVM